MNQLKLLLKGLGVANTVVRSLRIVAVGIGVVAVVGALMIFGSIIWMSLPIWLAIIAGLVAATPAVGLLVWRQRLAPIRSLLTNARNTVSELSLIHI